MSFNAEKLNSMFGEALNRGPEYIEKAAEVAGLYIQSKVRENSFTQKIIPPQPVTTQELTRSVNSEGWTYIDDLEPDSLAMTVNMRGEPEKVYMTGDKYEIKFFMITSPEFVKSENELRTYRMPLTKIIEQNVVKDMQEVVDKQFMTHVRIGLMYATIARKNELVRRGVVVDTITDANDGTGASGQRNFRSALAFASYIFTRNVGTAAQGGGLTNVTTWAMTTGTAHASYNPVNALFSNILVSTEDTFSRFVLRDLMKVAPARELKGRVFLLHETDWIDSLGWLESEAGLKITEEIVVEGYKYATVGGYTFVTTIRDNPDILEPGQIYAFPAPEFLGRYMILENIKFYIDRRGRFFHMQAWQECGIGFGNMKGLALILLAGAKVTLPKIFDTGSTDTPMSGGRSGTFVFKNNVVAPI